ncbi:MAG TPA: amidohydrolase family protein [Streptosporangiaceae bacterium]|nr:amidohydrolase family protein [Streptosporangiaceae bacterium]
MDIAIQAGVTVGGFTDHHTHLLKTAAGAAYPWEGTTVREFHERVWRDGSTPMDVGEPAFEDSTDVIASRLHEGLAMAASTGLVEITEMGMRGWGYLDALERLTKGDQQLPVRVRLYLASGLAQETGTAELAARRASTSPWIRLEGIKFYADGWLGPRTCAMCRDFDDTGEPGLLFADAATMARRIEPLAEAGWRIATHAIGDLGVQTVLDAYELVWGRDAGAIAAARPRIEHASLLSPDLIDRIAGLGVWSCIQPSFPVTDAAQIAPALGSDRTETAYPWDRLVASGAPLLLGTDFPIEVLDPLVSLARLVSGRSDRPGFATPLTAPEHSRLPLDLALCLLCDTSAGRTTLSTDPRTAGGAADLDQIQVLGTEPVPF